MIEKSVAFHGESLLGTILYLNTVILVDFVLTRQPEIKITMKSILFCVFCLIYFQFAFTSDEEPSARLLLYKVSKVYFFPPIRFV
jgi:hypothetical protein